MLGLLVGKAVLSVVIPFGTIQTARYGRTQTMSPMLRVPLLAV